MNKKYKLDDIAVAQLVIITENHGAPGYKNIIGIPIIVGNKKYFYSILDDCFFNAVDLQKEKAYELNIGEIYADVYDKHFGKKQKEYFKKNGVKIEVITKDIIISKIFTSVYLSDLEYEKLKRTTDVDCDDVSSIEKNLIKTELEYVQKLDRLIMCPEDSFEYSGERR